MVSLRPATEADYDFLYALLLATMKAYVTQTWGWDEELQSGTFRRNFNPSQSQIIVVDGQDVGKLTVERRPDEIFLGQIQIAPDAQGHGLGAAVIQDLLAEARERDVSVRLRVLRVNPARRLYERLGFQMEGQTETHLLMKYTKKPLNLATFQGNSNSTSKTTPGI